MEVEYYPLLLNKPDASQRVLNDFCNKRASTLATKFDIVKNINKNVRYNVKFSMA